MYKPKLEKNIRCPLEYGLDVFGGKWKSRIICVLADKKVLRYSSLRKEMINITDAVLASALKELISDGIIDRHQYDEIPLELSILLQKRANQLCLFYRIFASGQELIIKRIVKTHYFNVKSVTINRRKI